jgi:hypothetical protein
VAATSAMTIYRENRIQESEFRIQEKSSSCLFSSTGAADPAMNIDLAIIHTWGFRPRSRSILMDSQKGHRT